MVNLYTDYYKQYPDKLLEEFFGIRLSLWQKIHHKEVVEMSLDKAIKHGKEKRRQYTGARAIDPSCRNHGSCDWCRANRLHASKVQNEIADAKLNEYEKGDSG